MSVKIQELLGDLRIAALDERSEGDKFERVTVALERMRNVHTLPPLNIIEGA